MPFFSFEGFGLFAMFSFFVLSQFSCFSNISVQAPPSCSEGCDIYIPNVFTPNKDGINDFFQVFTNCQIDKYELYIFDRWGNVLFESRDIDISWDGLYKNKKINPNVFAYMAKLTLKGSNKSTIFVGDILLLR